jgi:hypothetical protein
MLSCIFSGRRVTGLAFTIQRTNFMKRSGKAACASLALLYALHPVEGLACRMMSEGEAAQRQQARMEQAKADALALYAEVDTVFIGRISRLTFSRETVKDSSGRDVVWQTHRAEFDSVENIKGAYTQGQVLEFKVNKSIVEIGCGGTPFLKSLPRENGSGETYLVYARKGQILRTNHIPMDMQVLSGNEEARHLLGAK